MADLSDTQIRSRLRSIIAKHWIDLQKTSFTCTKGIVRMTGELHHTGGSAAVPVDRSKIESMEADLHRTKGVQRVHFDFRNWRRLESGEWRPIHSNGAHVEARRRTAEPVEPLD